MSQGRSESRRQLMRNIAGGTTMGAVSLAGCLGGDDPEGGGLGEDDGTSDESSGDDDYPTQDVRHIIPWDAGGGTDTVMRQFMEYADDHFPTDIFTENVSGASSGVGVHELMQSQPNGHTIGSLTWDSVITVPYFGLVDGYDLDRLQYVCTVTEHATLLVAHEDSEYDTLDDLVEAAEENPGEISISNVGDGGVWHLPAVDFERKAGVEFNHVPFPGGAGEQRSAFTNQEVEVACLSYSAIVPALDQANILGVMSQERADELPDTPTFLEEGYDVEWGSFRIVAVPDGVPEDRFEMIEEACEAASQEEEFQEWLAETGGGGWNYRGSNETADYADNMQETAFELMEELEEQGVIDN